MVKFYPLVLGVFGLLVSAGAVRANSSDPASFNRIYASPQSAIMNGFFLASRSGDAQEGATVRSSEESTTPQRTRLVVMKELLKDVPSKDRADFLNQLLLKNGRMVSANLRPLQRTLNEDRIDEILEAFVARPRDASANTAAPPSYVRLSELLRDVPARVKNRFLDSLTFKDGVVVSAYVGDLRTVVSETKLKKILDSLYASGGNISPLALCGDNWCDDSACTSSTANPRWHCKFMEKWTCNNTCAR